MSKEKANSRYDLLLSDFMNLAINRFEWENLPVGLTSERMEQMLIENGTLMAYKKENEGIYILPCFGEGNLNPYGVDTKYRVTSLNGEMNESIELYEETIDEEGDMSKGILFKNNPEGQEDFSTFQLFAQRIDDIERTQEVNLFQQNIPKLFLTSKDNKLTAKAIIDQVKEFQLVVLARDDLKNSLTNDDTILDTTAPYILDKLQAYKNEVKNELLGKLGIKTVENLKKERMLVDEVNGNDDFTKICLDLMYDVRLKSCELYNQYFKPTKPLKVKKREVQVNENNSTMGNDRGQLQNI